MDVENDLFKGEDSSEHLTVVETIIKEEDAVNGLETHGYVAQSVVTPTEMDESFALDTVTIDRVKLQLLMHEEVDIKDQMSNISSTNSVENAAGTDAVELLYECERCGYKCTQKKKAVDDNSESTTYSTSAEVNNLNIESTFADFVQALESVSNETERTVVNSSPACEVFDQGPESVPNKSGNMEEEFAPKLDTMDSGHMSIKQEVFDEPARRFEGAQTHFSSNPNEIPAPTGFKMKIKSEISGYSTAVKEENSISFKLEPFVGDKIDTAQQDSNLMPEDWSDRLDMAPPVKDEELFITQSELQSITGVEANPALIKLEFPVTDELDIKDETCPPEAQDLRNQTTKPQSLKQSFICYHCGYQTKLKRLLVKHIRAHAGVKPYACNQCTFRTRRKGHLTRHLKIHSGEKPYVCGVCSYRTADKQNHQRHLLVHTGEKPYTCGVCNFRAADKSWFNKHLLSHSLSRRYACSDCHYRTASKSHLTRHIRGHTGEKPFVCNECPFRAADKGTVTKHVRCHEKKKVRLGEKARTEVKYEVHV